jgi:two-component system response regulator AtoC
MTSTQVQVVLAVLDAAHSASLAQVLMQAGATVSMVQVRSADHLLEQLRDRTPNLLVLELDRDGSLLEQVRARHPYLPIVVALAKPNEKITFSISRLGAEDVWFLPLSVASTVERAQAVLERLPLPVSALASASPREADIAALAAFTPPVIEDGEEIDPSMPLLPPPAMTGGNPRMAEIRDTVEKVAGTDVTVLIRGESGVGKEVIARLLFEYSRRRQKPFIKVN